jgi:hypothetical protein
MHVLIVLKSLFLANEASNPTFGITCLILYKLNLVLLSHNPLLDLSELFELKNCEFVNFELIVGFVIQFMD